MPWHSIDLKPTVKRYMTTLLVTNYGKYTFISCEWCHLAGYNRITRVYRIMISWLVHGQMLEYKVSV
jgi:hypothetical protein